MSTFVKSYVDGCATCQATKIKPRNQVPLVPNQVPTDVWGVITMDFITDLPMSQGFDSLFVVVDCLSKATIVTPCHKTITAKETSKLYMNNVWRRTGLPHQVISDRGPQLSRPCQVLVCTTCAGVCTVGARSQWQVVQWFKGSSNEEASVVNDRDEKSREA